MPTELPPFLVFFAGALAVALTRGHVRRAILMLIPVVAGIQVMGLEEGTRVTLQVLGYELVPLRVDKLSLLFGYVFTLAAFLGNLYALHLGKEDGAGVQHSSAMLYAGSAFGAVFAGDLITLFVFWELLAVSSVFLVWARRTDRSYHAGFRYLVIHVLSGVLLLSGALMLAYDRGSIAFDHIGIEAGPAGWLILAGLGIKAAFPLLHGWLIDAYPEGTPTGTVFLSAFTTKVAVYALARGFAGQSDAMTRAQGLATGPRLFIFVSLTMPRATLQRLVDQAARAKAAIVIRGFANGSLRTTVTQVQGLIGKQQVAIQIDPLAFDRFAITQVPSFVLVRDGTRPIACASGSCAPADSFLRSTGDVSLDYALEHMQRSAPGFSPAADIFLKRIRG